MNSDQIAPKERSESLPHLRAARQAYHRLEVLALRTFELTPTERELGLLLLQGLFYREIGQRLFRSESTIKSDARRLFAKVHVKDRRAFIRHIRALVESI